MEQNEAKLHESGWSLVEKDETLAWTLYWPFHQYGIDRLEEFNLDTFRKIGVIHDHLIHQTDEEVAAMRELVIDAAYNFTGLIDNDMKNEYFTEGYVTPRSYVYAREYLNDIREVVELYEAGSGKIRLQELTTEGQ